MNSFSSHLIINPFMKLYRALYILGNLLKILNPYLFTQNSDFCLTEITIDIWRYPHENKRGNRSLVMETLMTEICGQPVTSPFCIPQTPQ